MRLLSVHVGLPREVTWKGRRVTTAIFKQPVHGRLALHRTNLDGDRQADLTVHGGDSKAVYTYPAEHYAHWRSELPDLDLPFGAFGENFTTEGLLEDDVSIGDRFRVGAAEVMVTEPRMPCFKLALKFGRDDIVRRFLRSGRTGFYFAVLHEGEVGAGDAFERIARDPHGVRVHDIWRLYATDKDDAALLRRATEVEALPESWRDLFRGRLEKQALRQRTP